MAGSFNFVKDLVGALRSAEMGAAGGICQKAAAASLLFLFSALFLFFCAFQINAEHPAAPVERRVEGSGLKVVDDVKMTALDRVLYEDYIKSAGSVRLDDVAKIFAAAHAFELSGEASGAERLYGYSPAVAVKALAVLGGDSVCVLDVDGEEPGTIFREGDVFGGGRGQVLDISADGVTWRWAGREYTAGL